MRQALELASRASAHGDVPVGCVVTVNGVVVAQAENRRTADQDPLAHAEVLALQRAAKALGRWRMDDATMYVTLEPCVMCAGALVQARLGRLVYGTPEHRSGGVRSLFRILDDPRAHHRVTVVSGVLARECASLLEAFFQQRRDTPAGSSRPG